MSSGTARRSLMLGSSDIVAFAASADLNVSRVFYEQSLGLTLVEQTDFACVFDAHGPCCV
jgi:hypothetical protein